MKLMTDNRKQILSIAMPSMAENILQMFMGIVDNYLVAQIGLVAISGVSIANNIITVYQALFIALGAAVSSLVARSLAENNPSKHISYMIQAVQVTLVLSCFLGVLSVAGKQQILKVLGSEALVTAAGGQYLSIVGGGIVTLGLLTSLGAIVRAQGQTNIPMRVSLLTNVINVFLSFLAIYVFDFGVVGVAWSTVLSRTLGIFVLCSFLPIKTILKQLSKPLGKEVFHLSLPAAGERLMMRLGDVLIVAIIVQFGTEALAGNAIGETMSQFNYMPGMGMATATVISVASQLGGGQKSKIEETIRDSFWLATLLMGPIALVTYLLGPFAVALFTENPNAQQAVMVVLLFSLIGVPATSGTLVYTAAWQGISKPKLPFYATTIGMWLIRIIFGYVLGVSLGYGLLGVWLATVLDNSVRWAILYQAFKKEQKLAQ